MSEFKALRIKKSGDGVTCGFEMLQLADLSAGEVVIKSQFSGINYKDALAATGAGKILKTFPLTGGIDVAGEVETSSDARFTPGQRVVVTGCGLGEEVDGGYSEYVRVAGDSVIALPDNISCWEAMCLGTAGFTAALAITRMERNGLQRDLGDVVVTGATGGVGSLATSMLSGLGYSVVGVTGKKASREYLQSIGASRVLFRDEISYGARPLEKALWAGAIDNVGGDTLAWLTRTMHWWGNIASIGMAGGVKLNTTVLPFILRGVNLLGINSVHTPREERLAVWQRLAGDLRPGHLEQIGTKTLPLSALPDTFEDYLNGTVVGRTVIEI
ncbi:MAG: oxidoreductase [Gammaproteobacteria bacterium]|nr:oxidoreductase [Gammaproteobacteria bacterium]